uniref:KiSS-1 receptor (inferred by orthology to a human protein) n=1 Tax=Strongyloides venezuelensis TaxID=75913 RepID=A0A0K0FF81_STRVS
MLGFFDIVIMVVYSFMTLLGLIGNIGVLMVILVDRKFHEPTNMMIMNLALADLFFVLICIPPTSLNLIGYYDFPNIFCRFQIFFSYISVFVSSYTLVLLALDRFLAVVVPRSVVYYKTVKNSLLACLSTWILSITICSLILPTASLYYSQSDSVDNQTYIHCYDNPKIANLTETRTNVLIFYINFTIFSYVLPLTVITILYTIMLYSLQKQSKKSGRSIVNKQWRKKITKTVWLVIATFAICWFPQNIRFFSLAYYYPANVPFEENISPNDYRIILFVFQTMAYANSCINPLLYCLMLKRYRDSVKNFWVFVKRCICCRGFVGNDQDMQMSVREKSSFDRSMILSKKRRYFENRSNSLMDTRNDINHQEAVKRLNTENDSNVKGQFV